MESMLRLLAFGAGALFLGVGLTIAVLFALARRRNPKPTDPVEDRGEGCLAFLICMSVLTVSFYLFVASMA